MEHEKHRAPIRRAGLDSSTPGSRFSSPPLLRTSRSSGRLSICDLSRFLHTEIQISRGLLIIPEQGWAEPTGEWGSRYTHTVPITPTFTLGPGGMLTVGERLVAEDQVEAIIADAFSKQQLVKDLRHPAHKGFAVKLDHLPDSALRERGGAVGCYAHRAGRDLFGSIPPASCPWRSSSALSMRSSGLWQSCPSDHPHAWPVRAGRQRIAAVADKRAVGVAWRRLSRERILGGSVWVAGGEHRQHGALGFHRAQINALRSGNGAAVRWFDHPGIAPWEQPAAA